MPKIYYYSEQQAEAQGKIVRFDRHGKRYTTTKWAWDDNDNLACNPRYTEVITNGQGPTYPDARIVAEGALRTVIDRYYL